jgi:hypothetical protein
MSDIVVEPCGAGWTVRHPRILFERFQDRTHALRRARRLHGLLKAGGEEKLRLRVRRLGGGEILSIG